MSVLLRVELLQKCSLDTTENERNVEARRKEICVNCCTQRRK
jgi:hypothetical protein